MPPHPEGIKLRPVERSGAERRAHFAKTLCMNPDDLDRFLTQSLADRKLSGGEKSALTDWLAKNVKTDQHRGLVRHSAFEVARRASADPASAELVEWLEDVMKVLAPLAPAAHAPGAPM